MRIESIALKGLLAFPGEVVVDVKALPTGLIAIHGDNGMGKSTLLEAAIGAVYRQLPSRDQKMVSYAVGKDSYVALQFAIDGRGVFRARVNMDGIRQTNDAVLEQLLPAGTWLAINDGKVSTFDEVIQKEFVALDVFMASAFTAQGKSDAFLRMKPKDLRGLFIRCFGIERYLAMSVTAKDAAAVIEGVKAPLVAARDELAREANETARFALERDIQQANQDYTQGESRRGVMAMQLMELEARATALQAAVVAYAAADQRALMLTGDVAAKRTAQASIERQREGIERTYRDRLAQIMVDKDRIVTRIANDRIAAESTAQSERVAAAQKQKDDAARCDASITENQKLQSMADEIRAAEREVAECDTALAVVRADQERLSADLKGRLRKLAGLERDLHIVSQRETELAGAQRGAALLETVPCEGVGPYAACQFLVDAQAARLTIADLTAKAAGRDDLSAQIQALHDAEVVEGRHMLDATAKRTALDTRRAKALPLVAYTQPLAAAEARITELTAQKAQGLLDAKDAVQASYARLTERLRGLVEEDNDAHAHAIDASNAASAARLDALKSLETAILDGRKAVAQAETDLAAATAERDRHADSHEQSIALKVEMQAARADVDAVGQSVAIASTRMKDLAERLEVFFEKSARHVALVDRCRALDAEQADYQHLREALSHDGIPVLEIDAAGPTVSAYTNDLLAASFGPRFTVDLVTQRAKADGKGMIEDFIIQVFDNQKGGAPRQLGDLSGGEKIIVAEALANAIQIYVNTRSPMPIRTIWRDETTGALSELNTPRYVAMLRKVQDLAELDRVFFVTHSPVARAMADAQLYVNGGSVTTILPPYAA